MKLAVDIGVTPLAHSGTGRYGRDLARALVEFAPPDATVHIYAAKSDHGKEWLRHLSCRGAVVRCLGKAGSRRRTQITIARACWRDRVDVLHSTAYFAPLVTTVPIVLTIHDVNWWDRWRDWKDAGSTRGLVDLSLQVPVHAHRAKLIVTDSDYSRDRVARLLHLEPSRVRTVYPGLSPALALSPAREAAASAPLRLVCVGALAPQKNQENLLRAMALLPREYGHVELVLVGRNHRGMRERELEPLAHALGIGHRVTYLHDIDDKALKSIYRTAGVLIQPSYAEGFGLPVLEAMASGLPVAVSNSTSLPEVAGTCAEYFDPRQPSEIAAAIRRLIEEPARRRLRVASGIQRAVMFTWERAAGQLYQLYDEAAGGSPPC